MICTYTENGCQTKTKMYKKYKEQCMGIYILKPKNNFGIYIVPLK